MENYLLIFVGVVGLAGFLCHREIAYGKFKDDRTPKRWKNFDGWMIPGMVSRCERKLLFKPEPVDYMASITCYSTLYPTIDHDLLMRMVAIDQYFGVNTCSCGVPH